MPFRRCCKYNPLWMNGTTYRYVIPSGVKRSRGIFPSCRFYLVLVLSPTWWIPPLRFAAVGMTYQRGGTVHPHRLYSERGGRQIAAPTCATPLRPLLLQYFTLYRIPSSGSPSGEPASPKGSSCSVSGGILLHSYVVITGRFPERHTGRSLRFRWEVDSFIRTRCTRNVAGGKIATPTDTL